MSIFTFIQQIVQEKEKGGEGERDEKEKGGERVRGGREKEKKGGKVCMGGGG